MSEETSKYLEFITGKANELLQAERRNPGRDDIARLLVQHLLEVLKLRPDLYDDLRSRAAERATERLVGVQAAGADGAVTEGALQVFDDILAVGEEANQRLIDTVCSREQFWAFDEVASDDRIFLPGHMIHALLLFSFQARALMVASEIKQLTELAFYDGAEARVRTLYEIGIVSRAIAYDADFALAERYHASGVYERLKDIRAYNETCAYLGFPPPGPEERAECESLIARIEGKYGKDVSKPYGWAKHIFGSEKGRVTFADLDLRYGGDDLRPVYRLLNHSVHAGASIAALGVDFSSKDLTPTRPTFDRGKSIRALRISSVLLEALNHAAFESLLKPEEWDELSCVALMREYRHKLDMLE